MMKTKLMIAFSSLFLSTSILAQPPENEPEEAAAETSAEQAPPTVDLPKKVDLPVVDPEKRAMELLAEQAAPESVVWLQALEERFLALYEPDISGNPQGAVLILHAEGQHANWPNTIEVIRTTLPEYGWATLATTLPAPDGMPIPTRELPTRPIKTTSKGDSSAARNGDQSDEKSNGKGGEAESERPESEEIFDSANDGLSGGEAPTPPPGPDLVDTSIDGGGNNTDIPVVSPAEIRASQRINAALSYLNDQGQFNIVLVGDGMGAARGGDFVMTIPPAIPRGRDEQAIKTIRAMVIINARNNVPASDIDLPKALFDPEVPTLDIYFGTDQRDPIEAERRRKYAKRQGFEVYQQIRLPEIADNKMLGENRLARRVRGFLTKHAKGSKVDNAIVTKN